MINMLKEHDASISEPNNNPEKIENQSNADRFKNLNFTDFNYNSFVFGTKKDLTEINAFNEWLSAIENQHMFTYEARRLHQQTTEATVERTTGERLHVINMSGYNYLGYGHHPEVIQAAKDALDQYGLGAASSPVLSGTMSIHKQLEDAILKFFDLPNHGVSLFTSGYGANLGTISAFMKPGTHIILDQGAHMSITEGAQLSRAKLHYFEHNNIVHLEEILKELSTSQKRMLICTEGVYSTDGDEGKFKEIVRLAKQYGAATLVDEAHSTLISGEHGRGVSEKQGVLEDVDLYVMTFSKSFCGVGGAVLAKKEITRYINYFARCRMFSCALDPAVTGGLIKVLELASTADGAKRRKKIKDNAAYMKSLLEGKVDIMKTNSWIIPIMYGDLSLTLPLSDHLQRHGLDVGMMSFPAVPKDQSRIRLFITSEHTKEHLEKAAQILLSAAKEFGF